MCFVRSRNGKSNSRPKSSHLRRKVKVQFRTNNSRRNGGPDTQMLHTNFNGSKFDDYMPRQPDISVKLRDSLVEWLLSLHVCCKLYDLTAFAAVDLFDRFLSAQTVSYKELNYVVAAVMHIATKYHQTSMPYGPLALDEFIQFLNHRPDPDRLHHNRTRVMELRILEGLQSDLDVPTVYTFLSGFLKAARNPLDSTTEKMAYFFAKLAIRNYDLMIAFPPKMLAAGALFAACMSTCNIRMWRHTLQDYTGFTEMQLFTCLKWMVVLHWIGVDDPKGCNWWIPFS